MLLYTANALVTADLARTRVQTQHQQANYALPPQEGETCPDCETKGGFFSHVQDCQLSILFYATKRAAALHSPPNFLHCQKNLSCPKFDQEAHRLRCLHDPSALVVADKGTATAFFGLYLLPAGTQNQNVSHNVMNPAMRTVTITLKIQQTHCPWVNGRGPRIRGSGKRTEKG